MVLGKYKFARLLFALGLVTVLLVGISGVSHFGMQMKTDMDGNMPMSDCFMPGMTTLCTMNPIEHLAWWQGMFTSIPTQDFTLVFLLLLAGAVLALILTKQIHSPPRQLEKSFQFRERRDYIPLASPFQELFSNGILNPKLF